MLEFMEVLFVRFRFKLTWRILWRYLGSGEGGGHAITRFYCFWYSFFRFFRFILAGVFSIQNGD
ncbi:hypothetical protein DK28_0214785 [Peptococcaceae bacterium SCADC1_2_3]|nr:hypothetical protein DK28_0214785 [Peptococcaceae bacterium SCADC1_2_3]